MRVGVFFSNVEKYAIVSSFYGDATTYIYLYDKTGVRKSVLCDIERVHHTTWERYRMQMCLCTGMEMAIMISVCKSVCFTCLFASMLCRLCVINVSVGDHAQSMHGCICVRVGACHELQI